ncbi:hypothetical protein M569_04320 [Genlisea aurea]|uniref:Uncharacterized protein n=1 Tax=Genlisea aurea TaxID=192259 RepID=S8CT52_9LAMI|nr:hypothetical protein M569_04320 [Genlisea aurea]
MERKCRRTVASSSSPDAEKENRNSNWLWRRNKALTHVISTVRRRSLNHNHREPTRIPLVVATAPKHVPEVSHSNDDRISLLSDEILLKILSNLPKSQTNANSLVSKRWLNLQGGLVRSLKLLEWEFLVSGRLFIRFPNLVHVDLANVCVASSPKNSGVSCTHRNVSFDVSSNVEQKYWFLDDDTLVLNTDEVDKGLRILAGCYPNLRKLLVTNASEMGLLGLAEVCPTLQELELLMCNDRVLRGIAACENLQILRLNGIMEGLFNSLVSDVGLTILAQGCKRLVKLELNGCRGSYEGIKAIGQCCPMLEELTLCNHKMEDGWLPALPYCENLKALRFLSCKKIDGNDEFFEHLSSCSAVERLYFEKCQLRDKRSLAALFLVCFNVRRLFLKNCWGLTDEIFSTSRALRRLKFLSVEGCSVLTTRGLESVIVSWKELQSMKIISCNKIKDCEVSPALSRAFSALKDLKWKPDSKSVVSSHLHGSSMGKRGGKFFRKSLVMTGNLTRTSEFLESLNQIHKGGAAAD